METLEALEALLVEAKGLTLKNATTRRHDLEHAKELKDELEGRDQFRQCVELSHSRSTQDRTDAKEGFGTIAKQFSGTLYGQKAAERQLQLRSMRTSPEGNG